jgi:putative ABC transport system substrate-binding protein
VRAIMPAIALLVAAVAAEGQPAAPTHRIGVLATTRPPGAFRDSLRALGYVEGRNLVLEVRETEGRPERLDDLALELARLEGRRDRRDVSGGRLQRQASD